MTNTTQPTLVLMVGGPGAGKSYTRTQMFGDLPVVCADAIKATHPDYDPKNPMAIHSWSTQTAFRLVLAMLARHETFVYDSTGTNLARMMTIINTAKAAGVRVKAVLVSCSLEVAQERNAKRERSIDPEIVAEIHSEVREAWITLKGWVDEALVVDNG
jgi:predicted kinase